MNVDLKLAGGAQLQDLSHTRLMRRMWPMPAFLVLLFASVWAVATVVIATGTAIVSGTPHSALFWSVVAVLAAIAAVLVRATGKVGRRVLRLAR